MNHALAKIKIRLSFTDVLHFTFFISIICAFRAVTSICVGTMLLTGIIQHRIHFKPIFRVNTETLFAISCILFFFLQAFSLLYTNDPHTGLQDAQLKSGLVFTPLAIIFLYASNQSESHKLYSWYCLFLFFASVYLFCIAVEEYLQHSSSTVFFYHALVSPFRFHAVYYSILVFFSLIFLIESLITRNFLLHKSFHIISLSFLSSFLFLLSSKIVISFYLLYIVSLFLTQARKNRQEKRFIYLFPILLIICSVFVLLTKNPISDRFRDFTKGNISLIQQDKFSAADYFNGLQFRLLEWKLVPQILTENHSWWTGVSTGDAQAFLNKKYISLNMYRGEPGKPTNGYLNYNTHNQLLQSLLQSGIPGALSFLFICFCLIRMAWEIKKKTFSFTAILLLSYLFVESLFEEQYGIVIFTFWPLFIYHYCKESTDSSKIKKGFADTI